MTRPRVEEFEVATGGAVVEDHMGDTYRAVYTVKIAEKVYVLHCFQKKSQATAQADINEAVSRYKSLLKELGL